MPGFVLISEEFYGLLKGIMMETINQQRRLAKLEEVCEEDLSVQKAKDDDAFWIDQYPERVFKLAHRNFQDRAQLFTQLHTSLLQEHEVCLKSYEADFTRARKLTDEFMSFRDSKELDDGVIHTSEIQLSQETQQETSKESICNVPL